MSPSRDGRFATRGQSSAVAAVASMLEAGAPQALLLVGPPSVGKTTLALDLAAGLLCTAADPAARPCRTCRGCRLVAAGNHPDLHRLAPGRAGRQIGIGAPADPEPGTVRRLVSELALLPVEGGARVAVVEEAERMNEDAQNALLKTLEEPPPATTIVLCTSDEDRLLPTVRSRCARLRLGTVGTREIEALLEAHGLGDPPSAARLARLSAGRPGLALAYARAPEATTARGEVARVLVDLLTAGRTARLAAIRDLLATSGKLAKAIDAAASSPEANGPGGNILSGASSPAAPRKGRRAATTTPRPAAAAAEAPTDETIVALDEGAGDGGATDETSTVGAPGARASASERRRAALALLDAWRDLARDFAVAARGGRSRVRDAGLLDEIEPLATRVGPEAWAAFLGQLEATARRVEANANPELALDVLVLRWPHAVG